MASGIHLSVSRGRTLARNGVWDCQPRTVGDAHTPAPPSPARLPPSASRLDGADKSPSVVCNRTYRARVELFEAKASDIKRGVRVLTR
jgi:hypothetical protein